MPPFYNDSSFYSVEVIGDTIHTNSLKYKILVRRKIPYDNNSYYFYERIDSSTANVYRYYELSTLKDNEYLLDSLLAKENDLSKSTRDPSYFDIRRTVCLSIETVSVLSEETVVKSFQDQSYIPGFNYEIAKGFGYIGDLNCEFGCGSTTLLYAIINGIEYGEKITSVEPNDNVYINGFRLFQNYPNPFNSITKIPFNIPFNTFINISLYDIKGSFIKQIVSDNYSPGHYIVEFNAERLSSGLYFYVLKTKNYISSKKFLLIK